jgi:hypothetical protein
VPTIGEVNAPGCFDRSAAAAAGAAAAAIGNADVARDTHAQSGALDFDLGEAGFIEQRCQFAN